LSPLEDLDGAMGYFDGAAQWGHYGCGFVLELQKNWFFHGWMAGGLGTNSKVELVALWTLLKFASSKWIQPLVVRSDAKFIIDWACRKVTMHSLLLQQWGSRIGEIINGYENIYF